MTNRAIECKSSEGITIGIIDSIILMCRLFMDREIEGEDGVSEALEDAASDDGVQQFFRLFGNYNRRPPDEFELLTKDLVDNSVEMIVRADREKKEALASLENEQILGIERIKKIDGLLAEVSDLRAQRCAETEIEELKKKLAAKENHMPNEVAQKLHITMAQLWDSAGISTFAEAIKREIPDLVDELKDRLAADKWIEIKDGREMPDLMEDVLVSTLDWNIVTGACYGEGTWYTREWSIWDSIFISKPARWQRITPPSTLEAKEGE